MFDDDAGGRVEALDALQRGVGICDVVVGERLALQLLGTADAHLGLRCLTIKRSGLVWVLPVAHLLHLFELQVEGPRVVLRATLDQAAKVIGDHAVISGGVFVGANRKSKSCCQRGVAVMGFEFSEDPIVVPGRYHNGDVAVVLRCRTNHGWPADINIFHRVFQGAVRAGDGGLERIQIHDDQIDRRDVVCGHHFIVGAAPTQNAAVNLWVQGFHATIHHLWKTGVIGDFHHAQSLLAE